MQNAKCDEMKSFICQVQASTKTILRKCPKDFILYKNKCFYSIKGKSKSKFSYKKSQEECASRGSIVVPIKDKATFHFLKSWALKGKLESYFIGMNFSATSSKYSDNSDFQWNINFDFEEEEGKFGEKECVFLKSGVRFQPRSISCNASLDYLCQWIGNF